MTIRNNEISTKLNPSELERWKKKVKKSGLTSASLLRYLMLNADVKTSEE